MRTIYKYAVRPGGFVVIMPVGAEVLSVDVQGTGGSPQMWVMQDTDATTETRRFVAFGTGHQIPDHAKVKFIGTILPDNGELVFHVFEVLS